MINALIIMGAHHKLMNRLSEELQHRYGVVNSIGLLGFEEVRRFTYVEPDPDRPEHFLKRVDSIAGGLEELHIFMIDGEISVVDPDPFHGPYGVDSGGLHAAFTSKYGDSHLCIIPECRNWVDLRSDSARYMAKKAQVLNDKDERWIEFYSTKLGASLNAKFELDNPAHTRVYLVTVATDCYDKYVLPLQKK